MGSHLKRGLGSKVRNQRKKSVKMMLKIPYVIHRHKKKEAVRGMKKLRPSKRIADKQLMLTLEHMLDVYNF